MKEYLSSLVLVAAVSTLATLLMPEEEGRTRRAIEFGLALVVLLAILGPVVDLVRGGLSPDGWLPPPEETPVPSYTPEMLALAEEAVAAGAVADIAARCRIPAQCLAARATLTLDAGELRLASLTLTVTGEGRLADLLAVEKYVEDTYAAECEVISHG